MGEGWEMGDGWEIVMGDGLISEVVGKYIHRLKVCYVLW